MNAFKRLGYLFLPIPPAGPPAAQKKSINVGYTNCLSLTHYPEPLPEKSVQLKWYFAHASVGANMIDGLTDLHAKDKNIYSFVSSSADKAPPEETHAGTIYEHNRGNPGWKAKFDRFESCVSKGWRFPSVNVAMNKLCYIDQAASFKYYIHSMTNLEAAFPNTIFVYATIPLMTASDSKNYLRNAFNERLREWVLQNGRVLFDIADIEAHDPAGAPCTFTYRKRTCQRLCSTYTADGGHLNPAGRQLVARGFYALALALEEKKRIAPDLAEQA